MTMRAAWAQVDITPTLGTPIGGMGVPPTISVWMRDPLLAGVIVLEDWAGRRAAIVSMDLVGVLPGWGRPIRAAIARRLDCPESSVLLNASHTHSAGETIWGYYATSEPEPRLVSDYLASLSSKIIGAAERAASALSPARMWWHRGQTRIAVNRRLKIADGTTQHRPNPDGFVDRQLDVLRVATSQGEAVLFAAACHTVSVYIAQPDALSADFITGTRAALARGLGGGTHVQFLQGFAGDCRPAALGDYEKLVFRPASPGQPEAIGEELGRDVLAALGKAASAVELSLASAECEMPVMPGEMIPKESMQAMAGGKSPSLSHLAGWWLARLASGTAISAPMMWSLGALRLSPEHWMMHTAGEPVGDLATIVRGACGAGHVAALGYTQDYTTYLPTDAMLPAGGYEVFEANVFQRHWPCAPRAGIDQMVHDHAVKMVERARNG